MKGILIRVCSSHIRDYLYTTIDVLEQNDGYYFNDIYIPKDCFLEYSIFYNMVEDYKKQTIKCLSLKYKITISIISALFRKYGIIKIKIAKTKPIKKEKVIKTIVKEKKIDRFDYESFEVDYLTMKNKDLINKYKLSHVSLWLKAKKLKIKRDKSYYIGLNIKNTNIIEWTEEMIDLLKKYCECEFTLKELKTMLNISMTAIKTKMSEMGLKRQKNKKKEKSKKTKRVEENLNLIKQGLKRCSVCDKILPIDNFHGEKRSECKYCKKIKKYKITHKEATLVTNFFNNKCAYCGEEINIKNHTFDHVIPRAKQGKDSIENLVLACFTCNTLKGWQDLNVFYEKSSFFTKERYDKIKEYEKYIKERD